MIFFNGQPSQTSELSDAVLLGDGVFETLRSYEGKLFALNSHLERLELGLVDLVGTPFSWYSREKIIDGIERILRHQKFPSGALRISIYSDGNWVLSHKEYAIPTKGLSCTVIKGGQKQLGYKSSSYSTRLRVRRYAEKQGFDDAIFVLENGEVSELSTSNLIALDNGVWITPRLESGALPGVTRKALIENFGVKEGKLDLASLQRANSLGAISSLREIQSIKAIDGKDSPSSNRFRELQESFHSWILGNLSL
jgi:branched-chain amino acid aminotransferase